MTSEKSCRVAPAMGLRHGALAYSTTVIRAVASAANEAGQPHDEGIL